MKKDEVDHAGKDRGVGLLEVAERYRIGIWILYCISQGINQDPTRWVREVERVISAISSLDPSMKGEKGLERLIRAYEGLKDVVLRREGEMKAEGREIVASIL